MRHAGFVTELRFLTLLTAALLVMAAAFTPAMATTAPEIFNIRLGVDDKNRTRIVLDLNEKAPYQVFVRRSPEGRPQLSVEVDKAVFKIAGKTQGTGQGIGHLGAYAYAGGATTSGKMLFELREPALPSAVFLMAPKGQTTHYRLVIDLASASETDFTASLDKRHGPMAKTATGKIKQVSDDDGREAPFGPDPEVTRQAAEQMAQKAEAVRAEEAAAAALVAAARMPQPRLKPAAPIRHVIVIDPGHGGRDPGAIGQGGLYEKTVTLAASKTLKTLLEKRGYEVILTRDSDKRLAENQREDLEKRLAVARDNKAAIFLSVHADAVEGSPHIRGASVYTLSDKGSLRMERLAASRGDYTIDGTSFEEYQDDLRQMVFDISANEARNDSKVLAGLILQHLSRKVRTVNNSHRQENLAVLLSPDVPTALLELGFMSNAEDEKNLNSRAWRLKAMTAVADGIDTYFKKNGPVRQALNEGAAAQ